MILFIFLFSIYFLVGSLLVFIWLSRRFIDHQRSYVNRRNIYMVVYFAYFTFFGIYTGTIQVRAI